MQTGTPHRDHEQTFDVLVQSLAIGKTIDQDELITCKGWSESNEFFLSELPVTVD